VDLLALKAETGRPLQVLREVLLQGLEGDGWAAAELDTAGLDAADVHQGCKGIEGEIGGLQFFEIQVYF
jgi:hypothetical protein